MVLVITPWVAPAGCDFFKKSRASWNFSGNPIPHLFLLAAFMPEKGSMPFFVVKLFGIKIGTLCMHYLPLHIMWVLSCESPFRCLSPSSLLFHLHLSLQVYALNQQSLSLQVVAQAWNNPISSRCFRNSNLLTRTFPLDSFFCLLLSLINLTSITLRFSRLSAALTARTLEVTLAEYHLFFFLQSTPAKGKARVALCSRVPPVGHPEGG